jgi:peptide/nickel transport system ATP-binding protein
MSATEIYQESLTLLQAVNITQPEQCLQSFPHQLSGGQCQRVMIAMALSTKPDLLIADEPSTALDTSTQQQLLTLLHTLQQRYNMAVLFITHDLALVKHWCHRVVVLQQGELCEDAATETLFSSPQHPYTRSLLAAIQTTPLQKQSTDDHTVLLAVRNLYKSFQPPQALLAKRKPPICVLKDVSFDIKEQEILALVGESGCGKSTLGRALLMLDPADSGDIFYRGTRIARNDRHTLQTLRREWQVVFQDTNDSLNPRHTIGKILSEPLEIHHIGNATTRENTVRELLHRVDLPEDSIHRFPHEFSGGQRQRIGIARAIALNPKWIVCDEAVSALDVSTQAQIITLLLALKEEMKLSLLFITHDLNIVRRIADRVLVMQQGRIVESGTTQHVFAQPQHEATRQLLAAVQP